MSLVEAEFGGPTVFRDLKPLDYDYVPESLPHRDEEIRALARLFRGLGQGSTRENALVWGPVGSGKTVLSKFFTTQLKSVMAKQGKKLEVVHVNCRSRKSAGLAMLGILQKFDPRYPDRGFSIGEMARDLRQQLVRRDCHLVVILDEVDALIRGDGSNLVYDLTRFSDETGATWNGISLILVSQQNVLEMLDDAALSTFKRSNTLELGPYPADQMEAIAQQRVDLAFHSGALEPDTVSLVADIAGEYGDARLCIEILRKSGQLADDEQSDTVTAEMVRAAKAHTYSVFSESKLQVLQPHPLMVLLALARRLRRDRGAYAITGQVEKTYQVVCEEFGEEPRGHTQFWKYLNQLGDAGFVAKKMSGKGQAGTTQFLSIPDIPTAQLEQKVLDLLATTGTVPAGPS